MSWVGDRLGERSTWAGIFSILGAVGIQVAPELQMHIISGVGIILGVIGVTKKG